MRIFRNFGIRAAVCALMSAGLMLAPAIDSYAAGISSAGVSLAMEESLSLSEAALIEMAADSQGAFFGYTNIAICNVESGNLNVRETGSTSGKMVGKLPKNAACEVLSVSEDGWAHITSGEVEGYVSSEFLLMGASARVRAKELVRTVAISNTDGLNIRMEPNTESGIFTQILKGGELEYVQTLDNGWVEVSLDDETAYVSSEFVEVTDKLDTAITMSELLYGQGISDLRVNLCEFAKQFVGNPYVWGGTSLTKGADCSGFVLSVYKHFGITLSHSSRAQAGEGKKISFSEIQPGDLVFYANGRGTINHVAIYIGGGRVISASSPKTGIKIAAYNYRTPVRYVRILAE